VGHNKTRIVFIAKNESILLISIISGLDIKSRIIALKAQFNQTRVKNNPKPKLYIQAYYVLGISFQSFTTVQITENVRLINDLIDTLYEYGKILDADTNDPNNNKFIKGKLIKQMINLNPREFVRTLPKRLKKSQLAELARLRMRNC
jgi:hypothetical protein